MNPRYNRRNGRTFNGFTLIELLVVTAIAGLMTSMLVPALSKARGSSLNMQCQSNEHGFGVAMGAYGQDYAGYLPYNSINAADWVYSATDPMAGSDIWASLDGNSDVNGPVGIGKLVVGGYTSLDTMWCKSFRQKQPQLESRRNRWWSERQYLFGLESHHNWDVNAAYCQDHIDMPDNVRGNYYYRSSYVYRGGDLSYTPPTFAGAGGPPTPTSVAAWLATPGVANGSLNNCRVDTPGTARKVLLGEFRANYHLDYSNGGMNVLYGDGSVAFFRDSLKVPVTSNSTPKAYYVTAASPPGSANNRLGGAWGYYSTTIFDYLDSFSGAGR